MLILLKFCDRYLPQKILDGHCVPVLPFEPSHNM
jgi:hypothetical protein